MWKDRMIFFDCEVFKYDWLFVFEDINETYYCFHNDYEGISKFIEEHKDSILCGYNNKFYDNYILKGILLGKPVNEIKEINDAIIGGVQGWEIPNLSYVDIPTTTDLMSDVPMGLSLKEIEGNLGMNIKESEVDFNIDRPLSKEEFEETLAYCKHDVNATKILFDIRFDYVNSKVEVGKLGGLECDEIIGLTNAKLTAKFLKAIPQEWNDSNDYVIPDNVDLNKIPKEVIEFFNKMKYVDETQADTSSKLKIDIASVPHTVGMGGLHGAIPNYKEGE